MKLSLRFFRRLSVCLCLCFCACPMLLASPAAQAASYSFDSANRAGMQDLLITLWQLSTHPETVETGHLENVLQAISAVSEKDGIIARSVADHWLYVYGTGDTGYQDRLFLWDLTQGEDAQPLALALEATQLVDSPDHAFVVLGYCLENGEMTRELQGRCEAAAAAARSFPQSILVCSGGATGSNNPERHTEAGLMKAYLTQHCGLDGNRIYTDERALDTVQNAVNTFAILRTQGIHTLTIVTSGYHQKWGQVLYNAQAAIDQMLYGTDIRLVENYSYVTPAPSAFANDMQWAMQQLCMILNLPSSVRSAVSSTMEN